jgi:hypothetical protein
MPVNFTSYTSELNNSKMSLLFVMTMLHNIDDYYDQESHNDVWFPAKNLALRNQGES